MRRVVLLAVALGVLKLAVLFDRASLTVQFLAAAGLVTAWLASLYFKPFGACWRCGGRGNIVRKGKRKAPKCWACKGIGRRQRAGARTLHRIRRQVAAHWRWPR